MVDPGPVTGDGKVPAIYTYFGQFVDHDITFETSSFTTAKLLAAWPGAPAAEAQIRDDLKNLRTASLELDSLYGPPAPRDPANHSRMLIGKVTKLNGTSVPFKRPPGKGDDNDLPREQAQRRPAARPGGPHRRPPQRREPDRRPAPPAFLKAHNRLVDQGRTFEEARRLVRQHYQHIVLQDFLKRVADPAIVDAVITGGNRFYDALGEPFFLPLEFTVAGYRFGHTMIRDTYDFNLNFPDATLGLLFTFTALSGELGDFDTLPDNWIIQWERFIARRRGQEQGPQVRHQAVRRPVPARRRSTGEIEQPADAANLAVRNLLRGYGLRMPTGQAMAARLGLPVLSAAQLEAAAASETPGPRAEGLRVPGADAALVLPAGRGQAPRRPAPRPGRQHPGRRGAGRPGPAQRGLHPGHARLGAVAALGHAGQVRAGRPAAVRQGRRGRGRAQDLQGQEGRHAVRASPRPSWATPSAGRSCSSSTGPRSATATGSPSARS